MCPCLTIHGTHAILWIQPEFHSALHAYDEMKAKDVRGEEPLYRSRQRRKVERLEARRERRKATGLKSVGKVLHIRQWCLYLLHLEAS